MVDSSNLQVYLPIDKGQKMVQSCDKILNSSLCSMQDEASLVGLRTLYCKALDHSEDHLKCLEKEKILALARRKDDYDVLMSVSKRDKNM